jgi:hypothetical protein
MGFFYRNSCILFSILVIGLSSRKILFRKKLERYIQAVAWSVDAKSITILNSSYCIGVAPHELLFSFVGHPVRHNNFYLEVINIHSGESLQFFIIKSIIYALGSVFCKERHKPSSRNHQHFIWYNPRTL